MMLPMMMMMGSGGDPAQQQTMLPLVMMLMTQDKDEKAKAKWGSLLWYLYTLILMILQKYTNFYYSYLFFRYFCRLYHEVKRFFNDIYIINILRNIPPRPDASTRKEVCWNEVVQEDEGPGQVWACLGEYWASALRDKLGQVDCHSLLCLRNDFCSISDTALQSPELNVTLNTFRNVSRRSRGNVELIRYRARTRFNIWDNFPCLDWAVRDQARWILRDWGGPEVRRHGGHEVRDGGCGGVLGGGWAGLQVSKYRANVFIYELVHERFEYFIIMVNYFGEFPP